MVSREKVRAGGWGVLATAVLAALIVLGSRNLRHFDAALVGYPFATLFAAFGITYRYAMWLQRPPTRMYWRRGWRAFVSPRLFAGNLFTLGKRFVVEVVATRFIFRRGVERGLAHWLIMWGGLTAAPDTARAPGRGRDHERVAQDPDARAAVSGLLKAMDLRMGLYFAEGRKGKRTVRVLKGGLIVTGATPLPVRPYGDGGDPDVPGGRDGDDTGGSGLPLVSAGSGGGAAGEPPPAGSACQREG